MEYIITFIFAILIILTQLIPSNNQVDVSQSVEVQEEVVVLEKPDYSDGVVVSLQDHQVYFDEESKLSSEDSSALKAMIASGDFSNADTLEDQKTKDLLNLSSYYSFNAELSDNNPYAPKLLIDEGIEDEKLNDLFKQIQSNFGGLNTVDFEDDKVESNYSFEEFEAYEYEAKDGLSGATFYKYDVDHDGLDEIIAYVPGGSMGNFTYFIFQLNDDNTIASEDYVSGIGWADFIEIDGEYYIVSSIMEYNTKEFLGYNISTFSEDGSLKNYKMVYEKKDTLPIFSEINTIGLFPENLDVNYFVEFYKDYKATAIGVATNLEEDILAKLGNGDSSYGVYTGVLDVNNDGILDYTNNYMDFTSSGGMPSFFEVSFLDGESESKSTEFTSDTYTLYRVIPCTYDGKNYFMVVSGNNAKSYLLSLVEIVDFDQVVLQNYFVVEKCDILVYED